MLTKHIKIVIVLRELQSFFIVVDCIAAKVSLFLASSETTEHAMPAIQAIPSKGQLHVSYRYAWFIAQFVSYFITYIIIKKY